MNADSDSFRIPKSAIGGVPVIRGSRSPQQIPYPSSGRTARMMLVRSRSCFLSSLQSGGFTMKVQTRVLLTAGIVACASLARGGNVDKANAGVQPAALKLVQTIVLPGVSGRFDHFDVDAKGHRLFVAALGHNTLEVLDVEAGQRLKSIAGLHKPTGVLYLASPDQIGVANGDDGTFKLFDGTSYALVKSLGSLDDADNVRFDAKAGTIYVGYGSGSLAAIDAVTMKQTGSIKLPAHPEAFRLQTQGSQVFVNIPDAEQIAVIDRQKLSIVATWPMKEFRANFPMALDEANHRLFVGCRKPARLVVFDTKTAKVVSDTAISGDIDDLFYDATRKRLYLSCGEGFLDVVAQRDPDHYERTERIVTASGARTSFYSPALDRLWLAVPQRGRQPAEIRTYQPQ